MQIKARYPRRDQSQNVWRNSDLSPPSGFGVIEEGAEGEFESAHH